MKRVFGCCFCGTPRPKVWRGKGWFGVLVQARRQRSHWCCPKCKFVWDVVEHARNVADGIYKCEPPRNPI